MANSSTHVLIYFFNVMCTLPQHYCPLSPIALHSPWPQFQTCTTQTRPTPQSFSLQPSYLLPLYLCHSPSSPPSPHCHLLQPPQFNCCMALERSLWPRPNDQIQWPPLIPNPPERLATHDTLDDPPPQPPFSAQNALIQASDCLGSVEIPHNSQLLLSSWVSLILWRSQSRQGCLHRFGIWLPETKGRGSGAAETERKPAQPRWKTAWRFLEKIKYLIKYLKLKINN